MALGVVFVYARMALPPLAAAEPKPWVAPTGASAAEAPALPESGERTWVMPECSGSKTSGLDPQGRFVLELAGAINRASAPDQPTQPVLAILPTPGSPGVQLRLAARC